MGLMFNFGYDSFWDIDWCAVGRATMAKLPLEQQEPFIDWLERNDDMLNLYERFPGEALKKWEQSVDFFQLKGAR